MSILGGAIAVIGIIAAIVCMGIVFRNLRNAIVIRSIVFERKEGNNNEQAVLNTVELIKEAKDEIEIFDDGDFFPGSAYEDNRVIDAVKDKLNKNPNFKFRFLFNIGDNKLRLIQTFYGSDKIEIYARKDQTRPPDRHYRIIDGGVKGTLSEHDVGDGPRTYQKFYCRARAKSDRRRAGRFVFKKWGQDMENFEKIGGI